MNIAIITGASSGLGEEFARRLLTQVNPYTGLTWAEDPALASVNLVNENTPLHQIRMISGPLREAFDRKFDAWRREHPGSPDREREYRRFLGELYREFYNDMKTFLRKLGVTAPLTDQNYIASPNAAADRVLLDVVDLHLYGDHPEYPGRPWQPPARFGNRSQLARRLKAPLELAPARLFGKPFLIYLIVLLKDVIRYLFILVSCPVLYLLICV